MLIIHGIGVVRSLRGLLDSREHDKTKELLSRFERLRAELILGVGVETHQQVHMIDKKLQTMGKIIVWREEATGS